MSLSGPLEGSEVVDVWPKVEPFLASAVDRDGDLDTEDLLEQMSDGLWGLYVVRDDATNELIGAICCEVQEWPKRMVFNIAHCGGTALYRWAGLLGALESEAARLDCETVRITGRKGWAAIYPDYREVHRVIERKVVMDK